MIKEIKSIPLATLLSQLRRSVKMLKGGITRRGDSLPRIRDGPTNEVGSITVNSISTVAKAIQYIKDYKSIHCYLDNDIAGCNANSILSDRFGNVIALSNLYFQFNDLNKYLMHPIQSANTIKLIFQRNKIFNYGYKC